VELGGLEPPTSWVPATKSAGDDGWFRTGAVVSIDGRGSIRIRDRFRGAAVADEHQLDGGRRRHASGPRVTCMGWVMWVD
jgi:hypothetical protein